MRFNIDFWYEERYLPTKRHRNERVREVKDTCVVNIKEPTEEYFPIAFIIHTMTSVYENAKSYSEFDGSGDYRMFAEEIRTYKGKLYIPIRVTHGAAISLYFKPLEEIARMLEGEKLWYGSGEGYSERSVVKSNTKKVQINEIKQKAKDYLIFEGKIWRECGEPMYNITTFGLGHNHGGTGFFITYHYNPNISRDNYFNALEREKAIVYGRQIALGRGDTESVDHIGEFDMIEVLIPEMVKRKPQKEHGEGCPFMNTLESIINTTDSANEAGLLAMALATLEKM